MHQKSQYQNLKILILQIYKNLILELIRLKYRYRKKILDRFLTGVHLNKNDMVTLDGFRISVNIDDDLFIEDPMTIPYKKSSTNAKSYMVARIILN